MITIAHIYNEIINHYHISTQEKLGGGKLCQQPHSVGNPTKAEHAHQVRKEMATWRIKTQNQSDIRHTMPTRTSDVFPFWYIIRIMVMGVWKIRKSGIWNLDPESWSGTGTRIGEINECFKLGSMIHIKPPPPFSAFLARWMTIRRALLRKGTSTKNIVVIILFS